MPNMPEIQDTPILRIVFEHTQGPWKGLREIVGTSQDFGDESAPPTTSEPFNARPDNRAAKAGLVSAARKHLLYREINFSLPVRLR